MLPAIHFQLNVFCIMYTLFAILQDNIMVDAAV